MTTTTMLPVAYDIMTTSGVAGVLGGGHGSLTTTPASSVYLVTLSSSSSFPVHSSPYTSPRTSSTSSSSFTTSTKSFVATTSTGSSTPPLYDFLTTSPNYWTTTHASSTTHATSARHSSWPNSTMANGRDHASNNSTETLIRSMWLYIAPLLFIIGLTGNTLTVAVSRRKRLRKTPVSVFLSAMACIDNLVLLTGIVPEWLTIGFGYEIRDEHAQACKWSKFLAYTTGDAAIWILVAFTVDRFGAICFPLRKSAHLRVHGAVRICVLLCLAAGCKNFHVFWTRGPVYDEVTGLLKAMCKRPVKYVYFERYIRPWIAFATVSVIPFIAITVANASIIHTLSKVKIKRASEPSTCSSTLIHTAVLCLSASFTFLICIAPSIVLLIGKPYWSPSHGQRNGAYDISKAICNLLVYVNHSINFFLYCLTGGRFRQEFRIAVISWFNNIRGSLRVTCGRRPEKGSTYCMGRSSMASMSHVTRGGAIRIHKDCITTDSSTVDGATGYHVTTPRGTLTKFNPTAV